MKKLILALFAVFCINTNANVLQLREGHPERYVVVKGDTLWDISAKFLQTPWRWPEIWSNNEYIKNPHLIYPGDVLVLVYRDGKPRLEFARDNVVKLHPQMREDKLSEAIPAIPLDLLNPFLNGNVVLNSEHDVLSSPYVVAGGEGRIISGAGDQLFARGNFGDNQRYGIYRKGRTFVDPNTAEILGYEMRYIGAAKRLALKDKIATLSLTQSNQEVRIGDHIIPIMDEKIHPNFFPKTPPESSKGLIIAVDEGITQIGLHSLVILNLGGRNGIEKGDVFAAERIGETVKDPYTKEMVQLPPVRGGLVMVVKVFDKLSYGLVMESTQPLVVGDAVINP
jgi:hypothetical protein